METRIRTLNFEMTPEVAKYLDDRLAQIEKFLGAAQAAARCEVELGKAEGHHKHSDYHWFAEIQLLRPGLERIVAHNHEPNVNAAIDMAKDELVKQLRKDKSSRVRSDRRKEGKAKDLLRSEE